MTEKINLKSVPVNVRTLIKNLKNGKNLFSATGNSPIVNESHNLRMEAIKYIDDLNIPVYIGTEWDELHYYSLYVTEKETEETGKHLLTKYFK